MFSLWFIFLLPVYGRVDLILDTQHSAERLCLWVCIPRSYEFLLLAQLLPNKLFPVIAYVIAYGDKKKGAKLTIIPTRMSFRWRSPPKSLHSSYVHFALFPYQPLLPLDRTILRFSGNKQPFLLDPCYFILHHLFKYVGGWERNGLIRGWEIWVESTTYR